MLEQQSNQPLAARSGRSGGSGRPRRLRPSGGYRRLRSYQVATLIYDGTVQAARSGGKNIAEGSRAAATTSQTELRLVNVARASLEELFLDYEDYLRQHRHRHRQWDKNDPEALAVRTVGKQQETDQTDRTDWSDPVAHYKACARWLEHADPGVVANTLICPIHQTNYLLDQQIRDRERDFVQDGGYSEQLAAARIAERQRQQQRPAAPTPAAPACPRCGKPMTLRTARKGERAGSQFWGCSGFPECKGTRALEACDGSGGSD